MYAGRTPSSGPDGAAGKRPQPARAEPVLTPLQRTPPPPPLELTLTADVVTLVDDAAGRWQHERGQVSNHSTPVGVYASTTHLAVPGTDGSDAVLTLTVFFFGTSPPETITMHGPGGTGSDRHTGSVSAASAGHADRVGRAFVRSGDTVIID